MADRLRRLCRQAPADVPQTFGARALSPEGRASGQPVVRLRLTGAGLCRPAEPNSAHRRRLGLTGAVIGRPFGVRDALLLLRS